MENETQFGIYKILFLLLLNLWGFNLSAQDYFIDLDGNKHEIEITKWNFDKFYYQINKKTKEIHPQQVQAVYRAQAEVLYLPISTLLGKKNHQEFFIPSIESVRALSIDNFRDENYEVWVSGGYVIYEVQELGFDFNKNTEENIVPIKVNDVFAFHDSVGFNKMVSDNIDDDDYKVLVSMYTFDPVLNDSIFNGTYKLKSKKFLNFFDEKISALTAILYNDKDKATYYINSLRNGGALILLLNLDLKKIELYRNSGNEKLAKKLEERLLKDNISYSYSFLDTNIFNFCDVYVIDAKNMQLIKAGVRENIFLDKNLKIDSSIIMDNDFYLFARQGTLYETQLENPNFNTHKKIVTLTPVVQDAMIIYDLENIQVMEPFPNYVRTSTSRVFVQKKVNKSKEIQNRKDEDEEFSNVVENKEKESGLKDLSSNAFGVAYTFNVNFYSFLSKVENTGKKHNWKYGWFAKYAYDKNKSWYSNTFYHPNPLSPFHFQHQEHLIPKFPAFK